MYDHDSEFRILASELRELLDLPDTLSGRNSLDGYFFIRNVFTYLTEGRNPDAIESSLNSFMITCSHKYTTFGPMGTIDRDVVEHIQKVKKIAKKVYARML